MNRTICLVLILLACRVMVLADISIDELSRTVVLLRHSTPSLEKKEGKVVEVWHKDPVSKKLEQKMNNFSGTALIIRHNKYDYLVTAKHVATAMPPQAEIVMNMTNGHTFSSTFKWISDLQPALGIRWFHHPNADISIHPLFYKKTTAQVHITDKHFPKKDAEAPLLSSAYVLGFPMGLGVQESLSPIAKKIQIASRLTSVDNPNISKDLKFILLDQALAQGYSGAPIFYIEEIASSIRIAGRPMKGEEKLHFVGIQSAAISDSTGGKISLVVPSSYLWEILESKQFLEYEIKLPKKK